MNSICRLQNTNMVCDEVCNSRGLIRTIAIIDGGNLEKIKKTIRACL